MVRSPWVSISGTPDRPTVVLENTYDLVGNRSKKTRISTGETQEYEWDHRNRLSQITDKDALGAVVQTVAFTYDVHNRRIAKTVDPDGPGSAPAETERYVHDYSAPPVVPGMFSEMPLEDMLVSVHPSPG